MLPKCHQVDSQHFPSRIMYLSRLTSLSGGDFSSNPADDVMLPCEFCDNLFPEDVIIQHQVGECILLRTNIYSPD